MLGYRRNTANIINTQLNLTTNSFAINGVGQTFYELITQQPYMFSKNDAITNSNSITLIWNYDLIIPKHANNTTAKLSNSDDYTQNLPFIDKIYIDISGYVDVNNININNNLWIRMDEITISGDYNIYLYKHYVFQRVNYTSFATEFSNVLIYNIINNNLPFSMRVYGVNYSNDYPSIDTRSLIYNNLSFQYVYPPTIPLFIDSSSGYNATVSIKNYLTLTYYNTYSIMFDINNTTANITNYNIDYSLNTTLASYLIDRSLLTTNINISGGFSTAIYSNMNFNITLVNLMSGSNYYHKVQVRNVYSDIYSEYSIINSSIYTLIPTNNAIGTSLDMSIKLECYKYVTNNYLNNANILYFNVNNTAHRLIFNNSSTQQFQITYPYFSSQHLEPYYYGYGKFVDNCLNLVTITISINNVLKQIINYGGFDVSNTNNSENNYNYSIDNYTNNTIIINNYNNINIQDIYESDTSYINKGFRLKGYFSLINIITNNNIANYFGDPSLNPYILNINYNRHSSVNNLLGSNVMHSIYVDNLIGNPIINNSTSIIKVSEVVFNMSVASVKYFNLVLSRHYSNINSSNKYIVGNRIIANYSTTNNISLTSQNILLAQADICANGIYIYSDLSYSNIAYFQKTYQDFSFNLIEKIYNLNNINGYTINNPIITNHYCDYNSFNKINNVIISSKLNLSYLYIYEISNILLIGSDLDNIQLNYYNNHRNKIMSSSLLYINSYFSNNFLLYPNSNSYNYSNNNNLDISYTTYGSISYDLSGYINPLNQGYKWIVFKIYKNSDISNAYKFNNNSYNIMITTDGNNIKFLPLKTMLKANNLFTDTIVDNIFNIANTDALMYGHATTINSYKRFFNIKQNFNVLGGIWTENSNSNNINYYNTANSIIYGSNVYSNGIYCPITNLMDDLTIYIGLKNSNSN